jgi:hypothetical protein
MDTGTKKRRARQHVSLKMTLWKCDEVALRKKKRTDHLRPKCVFIQWRTGGEILGRAEWTRRKTPLLCCCIGSLIAESDKPQRNATHLRPLHFLILTKVTDHATEREREREKATHTQKYVCCNRNRYSSSRSSFSCPQLEPFGLH